MSDQFVQIAPDSSGKKVDASELTVAGNTVERQRVVIADSTNPAGLAAVDQFGNLAVKTFAFSLKEQQTLLQLAQYMSSLDPNRGFEIR